MNSTSNLRGVVRAIWLAVLTVLVSGVARAADSSESRVQRRLYVATPGIRNYLEFGGHGVLVFDMDQNHRFLKRIASTGIDEQGRPLNVKGVCASATTGRLYVSTIRSLISFDLLTERILWEKSYEGGCDRMAISPDGKVIYLPSLEKAHWHVVDGLTGEVISKLVTGSGAHNTVYALAGDRSYLAGLKSPVLLVADTHKHSVVQKVGPFSNVIRPFTVNGRGTLCFVNVNGLLGFEVGDLRDGRALHKVEVQGFQPGPVKRHGCPSHGIGLTPDEKEIWVTDAANYRVHIFDVTTMPPKQTASVVVRDQPGWITFSLDGRHAYPSTGEVIEVATHRIVATLKDENGMDVQSEKMVEIQFSRDKPVRAGDQFGVGRVR